MKEPKYVNLRFKETSVPVTLWNKKRLRPILLPLKARRESEEGGRVP